MGTGWQGGIRHHQIVYIMVHSAVKFIGFGSGGTVLHTVTSGTAEICVGPRHLVYDRSNPRILIDDDLFVAMVVQQAARAESNADGEKRA